MPAADPSTDPTPDADKRAGDPGRELADDAPRDPDADTEAGRSGEAAGHADVWPEIVVEPEMEPGLDDLAEGEDADHLDSEHIRRVATLRRSMARSRSHWLIAAGLAGVASVHLLIRSVSGLRNGATPLHVAGLVVAILAGLLAVWAILHARTRIEPPADAPRDPSAEPDFSPLNDGSQQVRALDDMMRGPGE